MLLLRDEGATFQHTSCTSRDGSGWAVAVSHPKGSWRCEDIKCKICMLP